MRTVLTVCPWCRSRVRPCNLERHKRSHLPVPIPVSWGMKFLPARRPLLQSRGHDHRYDEVAPRGIGQYRMRIYRFRGGVLELIGAVDHPAFLGIALFMLYHEGEFLPDDATGVLDTTNDPGDWIVHPWALGRTRREAA